MKKLFRSKKSEGLPNGPNYVNTTSEGFIITSNGQWEYPGQNTLIPSNNITMKGVPYPVFGMDDTGYSQMMYPGAEYTFPGNMVYEVPMAQVGLQTGKENLPIYSRENYVKDIEANADKLFKNETYITPYKAITKPDEKNCINGICYLTRKLTNDALNIDYISNPDFKDDLNKNNFYTTDLEDGFEIGDILQYYTRKGSMFSGFPGKVSPANANDPWPQHAISIVGKRKDNNGKTFIKIVNNRGTDVAKVEEISEIDLMKRAQEGYKHYDGILINRYDPEKVQELNRIKKENADIFSGKNKYAKEYDNAIYTGAYKPKDIVTGKILRESATSNEFRKVINELYPTLGKSSNMPREQFDILMNYLYGIGMQESNWDNSIKKEIKDVIPESAYSTLRELTDSNEDDWRQDYWNKNVNNIKTKYKNIEEFKNAISEKKIDPEVSEYLRLNSPKSKGIFQQKEPSERGRYFNYGFNDTKSQIANAAALLIDNYHKIKKKFPNKPERELYQLAVLMHNSPSRALNPIYADYYPKNNDIDYFNKVEEKSAQPQLNSYKPLVKPQTITKSEKEKITKFLDQFKRTGGNVYSNSDTFNPETDEFIGFIDELPSKVLLREMGNINRYRNSIDGVIKEPYKNSHEVYMDDNKGWRKVSPDEYEILKQRYPGADTEKGWIKNTKKAKGGLIKAQEGLENLTSLLTDNQKKLFEERGILNKAEQLYKKYPTGVKKYFPAWLQNNLNDSDSERLLNYSNILSDDNFEFERALANSDQWYNNWYEKRSQIEKFKNTSEERKNIANENSLNTIQTDKISDFFRNLDVDNLNEFPNNFFENDNRFNNDIGGYYVAESSKPDVIKDKIYMNMMPGQHLSSGLISYPKQSSKPGEKRNPWSTTYHHEALHKFDFNSPQKNTKNILTLEDWNSNEISDPLQKIISKDDILTDWRTNNGKDLYQYEPTEVRARLNVWRMLNDIDPLKNYTDEELKSIIDKDLQNPDLNSNIKDLYRTLRNDPKKLKFINDNYVSNQTKSQNIQYAANGGLVRAQNGKENKLRRRNQSKEDDVLFGNPLKELEVIDEATGWGKIRQDAYKRRLNQQKAFQEKWYSGQEYDPSNIERRAGIYADDAAAKYILDNHASRNDFANRQDYLRSFTPQEREVIARSNYTGNFDPDMGSRFRRGLGLLMGTRSSLTNPDSDLSAEDYANRNFLSNIGDIISPVTYPLNVVRGAVTGSGKSALRGETANPWVDATDMALGNEEDVWKYNLEGDIIIDPLNFAGTGIGGLLYDDLGKVGNYLTTQTPLKNTYKINPWAFKPQEGMMYRGLGQEGMKDAIQSGVFRPKQFDYAPNRSLAEKVTTPKQFGTTFYAPAEEFGVLKGYGPNYLAEVPFEGNQFVRRYGRKNWSWSTPRQIPIDEGRILQKDWLRGYKPIKTSKQAPSPSDKVVNSILDNPEELEVIKNNTKLSDDDIVKLEGYLNEVYDYNNLTPFQKKKLLDRETYNLNRDNVSVDQRIENNKKLLDYWEDYKKDRIEYFNSPKFKERVNKQYGEMADEIFEDFKNGLLENLEKRPYIRPDIIADYAAAHYKPIKPNTFVTDEHIPGHTYYRDKYATDKDIVFHEGRHQLTNAEDKLYFFPSREEIEKSLIHPDLLKFDPDLIDPKLGANYFLSPQEFITRLDELKRDMSKVGYDYKTMDLTPEMLKKYKGLDPREAIFKVTGKSSGVKSSDLTPEQYEAVIQLLDQTPSKTQDSERLLRWFKDDFLLDQINNKWGLIPPAAIIGAGAMQEKKEKLKYKSGGSYNPNTDEFLGFID